MDDGDPTNRKRIDALRRTVNGPVFSRGEEGYRTELEGANTLSPMSPDLVVGAASEADVQAAVRFAAEHGLDVVVQATGHGSYRPVDTGLVIRTHRLDSVAVDPAASTVTIGAGAQWRRILPELAAHGLAAVTGSSATVGAVGLILGGGIGPLSRTLGWAADRAVRFRVVIGDGSVVAASADEHPDLFWALKGGKVGLGVVTELTLSVLPMAEFYGGGLFFAEEHIEAVFRAWLPWARDLPDAANTSVGILRLPPDAPEPLAGRTVLHLRFAYVAPEAEPEELRMHAEELLAVMRAAAPVGLLPAERVGEIHAEPADPLPVWERGEFLDEIDDHYVTSILRFAGAGVQSPFVNVETRLLGGAIGSEPELPSAIGGRGAAFSLLTIGIDIPGVTDRALREAGAALYESVAGYSHREINYNWAGHPTDANWERLWSPKTAARLARVRAQYDPDGRFAFGR